jgi:protein SCO1/2
MSRHEVRRSDKGAAADQVMPRRWIVLAGALVLAVAGLVGVAAFMTDGSADGGRGSGTAAIGGPFRLTDQNGNRVTNETFAGRNMLIYFGYTYCPDICPLSLQNMVAALDELSPAEAERVAPIFITVDPERDTVEQLASYVPLFDDRLIGLTGTDAEIKAAARAYRVYFAKAEVEGSADYLMDHSSFIYLMGPDGTYRAHFGHDATPQEIAARLRSELGTS